MRNAYKNSVGNPEGKTPLGRPMRRWENLKETGCAGVGWIHLAHIGTCGGLL